MEHQDKYCQACGSGLIKTAVVCPKCGSPVLASFEAGSPSVKSKTVAIVLTVIFGPWGWLYTFSKNKVKFFIALPFQFIILYFQLAVVMITLNDVLRSQDSDPRISLLASVISFIFGFPFWLWSVIDMATKPDGYFANYTKKRRY